MNKNTVSLHITEDQALALNAILDCFMTVQVVGDLGLTNLAINLRDELGEVRVYNYTGVVKRSNDKPVTMDRSIGRHITINFI